MIEALPNAHAAVLHFPIALLPIAVALEAAALLRRSSRDLDGLSALGWSIVTVSTLITFLAGRSAADGLPEVPPRAQLALAAHADAAWVLLLGVLAVFVLRMGVFAVRAGTGIAIRVATVVIGCALILLMVGTADRGGALVYRHSLAVQSRPAREPECAPCERPNEIGTVPASTWTVAADGSATWNPRPGDLRHGRHGLRTVGRVEEGEGEAFTVRADGRALVLVPGTWGNVQVNLSVDLRDFEGTTGVVHHVSTADGFDAFEVSTGTRVARLVRYGAEGPRTLRESGSDSAAGVISVSAAGSHVKGMLDGKLVAHGHAVAAPDGAVGMLLDGVGEVHIRTIEVVPLDDH